MSSLRTGTSQIAHEMPVPGPPCAVWPSIGDFLAPDDAADELSEGGFVHLAILGTAPPQEASCGRAERRARCDGIGTPGASEPEEIAEGKPNRTTNRDGVALCGGTGTREFGSRATTEPHACRPYIALNLLRAAQTRLLSSISGAAGYGTGGEGQPLTPPIVRPAVMRRRNA